MTKHPIISREVTGLVQPIPSRSFGRVGFLCSSIVSLAPVSYTHLTLPTICSV